MQKESKRIFASQSSQHITLLLHDRKFAWDTTVAVVVKIGYTLPLQHHDLLLYITQ